MSDKPRYRAVFTAKKGGLNRVRNKAIFSKRKQKEIEVFPDSPSNILENRVKLMQIKYADLSKKLSPISTFSIQTHNKWGIKYI